MKSLRWYAVMAVAAMLLSVDATAQLGKGRGGGGSPPSSSGQGGGKNPPSNSGGGSKEQGGSKSPPKESPPPRGNQGPPTKGDNNPPVRGNQGPPTKGGNNPPVRGNQGPPTKGDNNPPVRGNQGPPTKGDGNPPVRGNQGPPTKGDYDPPVRGNQGPPRGENPITKGNQGPPPIKGDQFPPVRGDQGPPRQNPITKGNQNPPSNGGNFPTGGVKPIRGNDGQGLIGKVRDSRNTKGNYGSVNNSHTGNNGPTKQPPIRIQSPQGLSIPGQAIREDDVRRRRNIYRSGYYHYDPYWQDNYFWCGNYIFNPWNSHCVVSPWYWYASLPGYLNYNCIRLVTIPIYVWQGHRYNYSNNSGWGNGGYNNRSELDYAVDDLRDAFENADRRALSRLVPRDGRVDIFLGNRYDYSLDADEFNNLMLDGIFNSDTRRYEIVSVETYRNEAEVVARHQFNDPWGRATTVYHWYRLEQTRRGYVITRFGTNDDNCWR